MPPHKSMTSTLWEVSWSLLVLFQSRDSTNESREECQKLLEAQNSSQGHQDQKLRASCFKIGYSRSAQTNKQCSTGFLICSYTKKIVATQILPKLWFKQEKQLSRALQVAQLIHGSQCYKMPGWDWLVLQVQSAIPHCAALPWEPTKHVWYIHACWLMCLSSHWAPSGARRCWATNGNEENQGGTWDSKTAGRG